MVTKIIQISSSYDRLLEYPEGRDHIEMNMNTRLHGSKEVSLERTRYIYIYIWRISWNDCFHDFLINSFQKMMK